MTIIDETAPRNTGIRFDQWGRYILPHPETGADQSWTRVTTISAKLADRRGLEKWAQRNIVLGLGARRDLIAQASACTPDDRTTLNSIVRQAEDAAKSKAGANMGSALHRLAERVDDTTLDLTDIEDPGLRSDIAAYQKAMVAAQISVVDRWTEQILVLPTLGIAGTCDRLVTHNDWPLPRIGDIKTGRDVLTYGMVEIPLQLALYAHATHWYDTDTGQYHHMPHVDLTTGIVMHVPAGKALCRLYEVDIAAGWEAVQLALNVDKWRARKDLAQQIPALAVVREGTQPGVAPPPIRSDDPANATQIRWLLAWIARLADNEDIDELAAQWPVGVPTTRQGGWTREHVDKIAAVCARVDATNGAPLWPPDPTHQTMEIKRS